MLHHIDVHVGNLEAARQLFDALAPVIQYRMRVDSADFIGYEPQQGGCPRIGFERSERYGSGMMRLAFELESRQAVDDAARIASENGACKMEGPSLHPEYGDDYYAVFFEDADGNLYELVVKH